MMLATIVYIQNGKELARWIKGIDADTNNKALRIASCYCMEYNNTLENKKDGYREVKDIKFIDEVEYRKKVERAYEKSDKWGIDELGQMQEISFNEFYSNTFIEVE